jgi:cytochrome c553
MRHTVLLMAGALTVLWLAAGRAEAQEAPPPADIAAGKAIAATCADCHGMDGIATTDGTPDLAGQHAGYLQARLKGYRTGEDQESAMAEAVHPLTDADMANVAAYYASLKPFSQRPGDTGANAADATEADPFAALREKTKLCARCHGKDGAIDIPGLPALAGQPPAYLIAALVAYQDGTRKADTMKGMVKSLSRSDIEDIAYFYAAMPPHESSHPGKGDPYAGIALSAPCQGCHGSDGNSPNPKNPRLAGLDAKYLISAINAYKKGDRANDVMAEAVGTLRDEDVANLAAYYATQKPKALPGTKPLTVAEWTERCDRCHGPGGNSTDDRFPIIAGQDETYLLNTIERFHSGERASDMMFAMTFQMSETDMNNLAAYYARQRKP